jgi:N-acyl-D-aspartate/D-glutamate deacylase
MPRATTLISISALAAVLALGLACSTRTYDLVIANGRVMDPATGFDQIAHVGIVGDTIEAVSERPLRGTRTIDASGLVVAPGLIELHSHGEDDLNYRFRAMDGITMMLETERGAVDVDQWYAAREGKTLVHFGTSVGHGPVRVQVMKDAYHGWHFSGPARTKQASPDEIDAMVSMVRTGLARGALGVGITLLYTPAATEDEVTRLLQAAAEVPGAASYVHVRHTGPGTKDRPGSVAALKEVLDLAEKTRAPLHVCHVSSSGLSATPALLEMIGAAKAKGLDVTTEFYPYTAAMSGIKSAWFDPGWQETLGISYENLQWPATGEFLTERTFRQYQREHPAAEVIIHAIPQAAFEAAARSPHTMVVSDGLIFPDLVGHPRGAGTAARVLGRLVREEKLLTLMEALRKMTIMPAERLEALVPEMRRKGRVQAGADADITIFNPDQVIDKATFDDPAEYSDGIEYVLVAGVPVVSAGELVTGVAPGRPVRAPIREVRP